MLELIVGVDLGFTCTGVAFCTTEENDPPRVINKWPQDDKNQHETREIHNKVPTRLSYRGGQEGYLWGLKCPLPGERRHEIAVKEHFKLFLDPKVLEEAFKEEPDLAPGSAKDVQNWFRHFLEALYEYMVCYFKEEYKEAWETGRVEYIFSVPTTWKKKELGDIFEGIVKDAGFGSSRNHIVTIGLTEAEGAAIYTAMYPLEHSILGCREGASNTNGRVVVGPAMAAYKKDDVLLVCDAGGGTTDVCVLAVKSDTGSPIQLEQLSHVKGKPIGSVQIDHDFRKLAEERLSSVKEILCQMDPRETPKEAAREMTCRDFQNLKREFGTPLAKLDTIAIRVRTLPSHFDCAEAGIKGGIMHFSKEGIEEMFDKQIEGMIELIDKQLTRLDSSRKVSYIVLSGGLGSSKYVQSRICAKYDSLGIKVLISCEPQLAVCRGLVVDRLYRLRNESSALPVRRCRASYGILTTTSVKKRHSIAEKVHWLVKKDEPVRKEKCGLKLSRTTDSANPEKIWWDKIVISSSSEPNDTPAPRPITFLETDLTSNLLTPTTTPGVTKIKHWTRVRPPQWKIDYEIEVGMGEGGLEFRSLFNGDEVGRRVVGVNWTIFPEWEGDGGEKEGEEKSL